MRPDPRRRGRLVALCVLVVLALVLNAFPSLRRGISGQASRATRAVVDAVSPRDGALDRARRARIAAEQRSAEVSDANTVVREARAMTGRYAGGHRKLIMGRAISFTPVAAAGSDRKVELDVGSQRGVVMSSAVVAPGGLVGRVTEVHPTTCTVTLLTDPASVVGGRIERTSSLARVTGKAPEGVAARAPGKVSLVVAEGGSVRRGDTVVTAGSPGEMPYPAGLPIGRVTSVDASRGELEHRATLTPAADPSSLDVVAVLVRAP